MPGKIITAPTRPCSSETSPAASKVFRQGKNGTIISTTFRRTTCASRSLAFHPPGHSRSSFMSPTRIPWFRYPYQNGVSGARCEEMMVTTSRWRSLRGADHWTRDIVSASTAK